MRVKKCRQKANLDVERKSLYMTLTFKFWLLTQASTAGGAKGGARTKWPCSRSCDLCPANQRSQNQETNPIEPWDPGQGFREIRVTSQCTPKVSLLVGLKQVQTQLLSFYVTLIHKNSKEFNPKIGGLLRYGLHRVVKSL